MNEYIILIPFLNIININGGKYNSKKLNYKIRLSKSTKKYKMNDNSNENIIIYKNYISNYIDYMHMLIIEMGKSAITSWDLVAYYNIYKIIKTYISKGHELQYLVEYLSFYLPQGHVRIPFFSNHIDDVDIYIRCVRMLSSWIADRTTSIYKRENNIEQLKYFTNIEKKQEVMSYLHKVFYPMNIGEVYFTEEEYYKTLNEMKEMVVFFKNNKNNIPINKSNNIFSPRNNRHKIPSYKNTKRRQIKYKNTKRRSNKLI
jgi:hypothetical protein